MVSLFSEKNRIAFSYSFIIDKESNLIIIFIFILYSLISLCGKASKLLVMAIIIFRIQVVSTQYDIDTNALWFYIKLIITSIIHV